jgi:MFS family permease
MQLAGKPDRVREVGLVVALALMFGYVALNRVGIGFILPPVVSEFHLEYWQASLLISGTAATYALSGWLGGALSDRLGRKPVLLVGQYASVAFSALFGAGTNFLTLFLLRDAVGLGEGVGYAAGQSSVAEQTDPSRRALYQGIVSAGYAVIGLGLGAFVMTHLADAFGWRWVYPILAIYGLIAITLVAWLLPNDTRDGSITRAARSIKVGDFVRDAGSVLRTRGAPLVMVGNLLVVSWLGLSIGFGALFLTRVRAYSLQDAGSLLAVASIIGFAATLLLPAAADHFGRKVTVGAGALVAGASYLLFVLGDVPSGLVVLPLTLASGGVSGIASILGATMLSELVPDRRGTAIGLNTFFGAIVGTSVVPVLGGFAADIFGLAAPLVLAGLCLLAVVLVVPGVPETAPRVLLRRAGAPKVAPSEAALV